MKIIGIDPGSRITGYGIIECKFQRIQYVDSGTVRTTSGEHTNDRLYKIFVEVASVVRKHKPDHAVVERVLVSQNVRSALLLGHARGSVICACKVNSVDVYEYTPREIKKSITGNGAADKEQMQFMVQSLLQLSRRPQQDEADALACAISHYQHLPMLEMTRDLHPRGLPDPTFEPA